MTNSNNPLVTVVIPAYNSAWCINKAVDSVLAQSWPHLEVLIINDGSTDDLADVLQPYGRRVRIIYQNNQGLSAARNTGIREAKGVYIAFLDSDDYWLPGKIHAQVTLMQENASVGFCSTNTQLQTLDGKVLRHWPCPGPDKSDSLLASIFDQLSLIPGSGSGVMVRTEIIRQTDGFDITLRSLEDIDMWMRLACLTNYQCIEAPLSVVIWREDSMSRDPLVMKQSAMQVLNQNRHRLPSSLRGRFWRRCLAQVFAEYGKWAYRDGKIGLALRLFLQGLFTAPLGAGRLNLSMIVAVLKREPF
ncbi:MAG: glycosyltransferase family 2 protein [Magnetococcales bacterium]|nr:glycosyltransferase family 2 protein [Magnetococcales bacterium]